jgi:hypothetical protein
MTRQGSQVQYGPPLSCRQAALGHRAPTEAYASAGGGHSHLSQRIQRTSVTPVQLVSALRERYCYDSDV